MTDTAASDSERQQLLWHEADSEFSTFEKTHKAATASTSSSATAKKGRTMASCNPILIPIGVVLAITLLWLSITGFVVVPPGELAVIVTMVRR